MRSLIEALLAYSRAGRGEEPERVELGSVAADVLRSLAAAMVEASAEIEIGELPDVMGDRAQLEQLLQNLIANALKFRDGRARAGLGARRGGGAGMAQISVADGGIGIPSDQREQVFEMFGRLHDREAIRGHRHRARDLPQDRRTPRRADLDRRARRRWCGLPLHASRSLTTMSDVAMPRLSDSMEEGTILKWLKSDGDEVSKGEELVEIETDKANMTYEADESGTLEIVAKEGDTLAVGETIAKIGEGGGGSSDDEEDESEDEPDEDEEPRTETSRGRRATTDDESEDEDEDERRGRGRGRRRGRRGLRRGRRAEDEADEDDDERRRRRRRRTSPTRARRAEPKDEPARRRPREGFADRAPDGERPRHRSLELKGTGPGGRIVKSDIEAATKGGDDRAEPRPRRTSRTRSPRSASPRATARPAAATSSHSSSTGCSAPSRAGWPSPRRPRRTS